MPDVSSLSTGQLREILTQHGIDFSDCFERKDLVQRVQETVVNRNARSSAPPPQASSRQYTQSSSTPSSSTSSRTSSSSTSQSTPTPTGDTREIRRIQNTKDFYQILSVSRDASQQDIKRSYRKLALALHPDKNKQPGAEEAFKSVQRAFDVLGNEEKRKIYDRHGQEAAESEDGAVPMRGFRRGGHGMQEVDLEDILRAAFGGGAFGGGSPFFQYNFQAGGMPRGARAHQRRQQQRPQQGSDDEDDNAQQGGGGGGQQAPRNNLTTMLWQFLPLMMVFFPLFIPLLLSLIGTVMNNFPLLILWALARKLLPPGPRKLLNYVMLAFIVVSAFMPSPASFAGDSRSTYTQQTSTTTQPKPRPRTTQPRAGSGSKTAGKPNARR
eukprot:TRINITY_DN95317_c0_g1_i1.p1 TRINITY_DN95317_c0_g1~~TRINITY_DN95317_c0_g1_i1.p1  ORF type:complete len:391 (+),score=45.29 TRINITY_DN95317_c0_g1_i1:28-1173(+)